MSYYMFDNPPKDAPNPDETPFSDVTNAHGTNTWDALLTSCRRIVDRLQATGELSSNDISDFAEPPRNVANGELFESFVWKRVCPTVATHPQVEWSDCWKFNPEQALSDDEFRAIASDFDIPAAHNSHAAGSVEEDPRLHYPRVIEGWYNLLRETYESDSPRHGISGDELMATPAVVLPEDDYQKCAEYLAEFPDISTPSHPTDRPDWVWIESDTEATDAAVTGVES